MGNTIVKNFHFIIWLCSSGLTMLVALLPGNLKATYLDKGERCPHKFKKCRHVYNKLSNICNIYKNDKRQERREGKIHRDVSSPTIVSLAPSAAVGTEALSGHLTQPEFSCRTGQRWTNPRARLTIGSGSVLPSGLKSTGAASTQGWGVAGGTCQAFRADSPGRRGAC